VKQLIRLGALVRQRSQTLVVQPAGEFGVGRAHLLGMQQHFIEMPGIGGREMVHDACLVCRCGCTSAKVVPEMKSLGKTIA